jgi:hypothetical protein
MTDIYELRRATVKSAQDALANRLISKDVFHRITDGTVSKYDLAEAKKLVEERRAMYEARKQDHPDDPRKWKLLEKQYYTAVGLQANIERQYAEQGYIDTFADNQKDWWNGSAW